jgi:uncharacterized paraquat-inducible protein A
MAGGAYLVIAFSFAFAGGIVGKIKGSSFWLWFLVAGAVPIFGLLAAVCYRNERTQDRMACPSCGKVVPVHDTICTRCGTELYLPEDAAEILPPQLSAGR